MSTDILRGAGSLRASDDKGFVAAITYQLWEKPRTEATPGEWWGNFTLDHIIDSGEYIIELEDGRKGTCSIRANISRVRGLGNIYRYNFQGSGLLA
jgi:hypothetical protein